MGFKYSSSNWTKQGHVDFLFAFHTLQSENQKTHEEHVGTLREIVEMGDGNLQVWMSAIAPLSAGAEPPRAGTLLCLSPAHASSSEPHLGALTDGGGQRGPTPAPPTPAGRHLPTRPPHRGETQLLRDFLVVFVPLLHLRLPGRQVAAHEAEAGAVELKADAHGALVACLSAHARLHRVNGDFPATENAHMRGFLSSSGG